ncbi:ABC transporter domain protein [Burkholderia sp. YI23]|nr:ABC transporter domain protein [Burkholderia sp. YI23]
MNRIEPGSNEREHVKLSAWQLIKPYWVSEEKHVAWALLVTIIVINLTIVYLNVWLNDWNGRFYDALQNKNVHDFPHLLLSFSALAFCSIVLGVYGRYLRQMLQFRWRQWLTNRYLAQWFGDRAFYRIERDQLIDNPDQRISDDLQSFTDSTLSLSLDLLSTLVTLISFVTILWTLAGALTITVFGRPLVIPGYLVWAAAIYALAGSLLIQRVGRPLVGLNYRQQKVEADFRFGLIRVRENAEQIAFYKGGAAETEHARQTFQSIRDNWWLIMKFTKRLTFSTSFYAQVAVVFPFVVATPHYFAGAFTFGMLMKITGAFGTASDSFSWFINSYGALIEWRATINRLRDFQSVMSAAHRHSTQRGGITLNQTKALALSTHGVTLARPTGALLSRVPDGSVEPGSRWLITGPSGSGKSTLMRALAGLWPFGGGTVDIPADAKMMFVPQTSYLPIGSLRAALCYPSAEGAFSDNEARDVLQLCHLDAYVDRLGENAHWARCLSPGEQQRLAAARVLLHKPDFLFLDESTSALDPANEQHIYTTIVERLPNAAIVSVAHREAVARFHDRRLEIGVGEMVKA